MAYHTENQVLSSIVATAEKKFVYKNNTKKTLYFNKFDLLPNVNFITNGKVYVTKNGITVFSSERDDKPLKKYSQFPISDKLLSLQRDEEFEIYVYSAVANSKVDLGISIELDHENLPLSSVLIPLDKLTQNTLVSEDETLFESEGRVTGDYYQLLNMNGYKKLIVNMAVDPTSPTVISNVGTPSAWTDSPIVDANLNSSTSVYYPNTGATSGSHTVIVDFGSIATRTPASKAQVKCLSINALFTGTTKVFVSDDNVTYTEIASRVDSASSNIDNTFTLTDVAQSFRYMKHEFVWSRANSTGDITFYLYEMYDSSLLGGTAALSFEVLNADGVTFTEYIASTEYSTTISQDNLVAQIGGDGNISASNQVYSLPSTATKLRAVLKVTGGGLVVGVVLQKIA